MVAVFVFRNISPEGAQLYVWVWAAVNLSWELDSNGLLDQFRHINFNNVANRCWYAGEVRIAMAIPKAPKPWCIGSRSASVDI